MELDKVRLEQSKCKSYSYEKPSAATVGAALAVGGNHGKKAFHPRTPSKHCNSTAIGATMAASSTFTTSASGSSSSSSIHISYTAVINTPPAKRFQRVRNPFEPVMTERLHLPLIASPSLFQRPTTPQLSSTQFEWTIEEVSSLKPTHVEPHETQFHDSPDPEYEAKAQSAISSYFKDQQIVPSPVDCPLRSQRIILSELNSNTPITKSGRRIRDCGTQTELTLPLVLPRALEEALRPYLQPHLAKVIDNVTASRACEDEEQRFSSDSNGAYFSATDAKDMSLRRKLFDMHNIVVLDGEGGRTPTAAGRHNKSNGSPTTHGGARSHIAIVGKLSDSLDKSSFGSLSPISASDGLSISPRSPHSSASKLKSQMQTFLQDLAEAEQLSPIHAPAHYTSKRRTDNTTTKSQTSKESYRCSPLNRSEATTIGDYSMCGTDGGVNVVEKFTPDRSSSPLHTQQRMAESEAALAQQSIDSSFNMKISRLAVNSSKCSRQRARKTDVDMYAHDDTDDMLDDDDDMQVSQLSTQSLNCSSSNSSDTPRSKRRSASRKNLSQSFSLNWLEDESGEPDLALALALATDEQAHKRDKYLDVPRIDISNVDEILLLQQANVRAAAEAQKKCGSANNGNVKRSEDETTRAVFYRTDSGFNEMPASGTNSAYSNSGGGSGQQCEGFEDVQSYTSAAPLSPHAAQLNDVSMVCCSTPSRRAAATS